MPDYVVLTEKWEQGPRAEIRGAWSDQRWREAHVRRQTVRRRFSDGRAGLPAGDASTAFGPQFAEVSLRLTLFIDPNLCSSNLT